MVMPSEVIRWFVCFHGKQRGAVMTWRLIRGTKTVSKCHYIGFCPIHTHCNQRRRISHCMVKNRNCAAFKECVEAGLVQLSMQFILPCEYCKYIQPSLVSILCVCKCHFVLIFPPTVVGFLSKMIQIFYQRFWRRARIEDIYLNIFPEPAESNPYCRNTWKKIHFNVLFLLRLILSNGHFPKISSQNSLCISDFLIPQLANPISCSHTIESTALKMFKSYFYMIHFLGISYSRFPYFSLSKFSLHLWLPIPYLTLIPLVPMFCLHHTAWGWECSGSRISILPEPP